MLNIVIPMAGRGSRFLLAGYTLPKPLIPVNGKPMIQLVIENLQPNIEHRFIFICQEQHINEFGLAEKLCQWSPDSIMLTVNKVTEGAACTVLLTKELINNDMPLMIANCDQWIDADINAYLSEIKDKNLDGMIMTMTADDPKWSFIRLDNSGKIIEVVEKQVVSHEATVGIYNYRRGSDFVEGAEIMISKNLRVNNEFYVAPVYNEMLQKNLHIGYYNIGSVNNEMYGLGTPDDLKSFERLAIAN